MNYDWNYIDGYRELPEGRWIVAEEGRNDRPEEIHIASMNQNGICVIGGHFGFDRGRIYAYTETPEIPEKK